MRLQVTGALKFCLFPSANGVAEFEVRLRDSGGLVRGGQDEQGPAFVVIEVFPLNQAPSFQLSCMSNTSWASLTDLGHLYCVNHLLAWRRSFPYKTLLAIEEFTRDMMLGERTADGSDIEASQSYTFAVTPSVHLFNPMPLIHANGTLEFGLLVNRTGQANLTIVMHDDGFGQDLAAGTLDYSAANALPYAGVNVSAPAQLSVVVAAAYAIVRFNITDSNFAFDCGNLVGAAPSACSSFGREECVVSSRNSLLNYTRCVHNLIVDATRHIIAAAEGLPLVRILGMNDSMSFQIAALDSEQALLFTSRGLVYAKGLQAATGINSIGLLKSEAYVKNWDHVAPCFRMTDHITILGFHYPEDAPFQLTNMVWDIVSPADSPLDDQGREQVLFEVKLQRWRRREGDPWQEANSTHPSLVLSSASIDVWCRAHCFDSRNCCNGTFVAVKPPEAFGDVEYLVRIKGTGFSQILHVHAIFSMTTLIEFTERWPGDQKETVQDFIQSSLDFRVSDPDSRGRPPLLDYDSFVQEPFIVTKSGVVSATIKQCVTNEHAIDAYLLVHPVPQSHPTPVQGTPRIELRKQGNTVFGELFVTMKPFAVGNASFYLTFVMPREPYNETNGVFTIVVRALNQPPRFTLLSPNLSILEDEFSIQDYVQAHFAMDIGPGPEDTPDEEGQSVTFSVHSQSTEWNRIFSFGPVLNANGTLIFRTNVNAFGTVLFAAVLTDDGDALASTAKSFNVTVLSVNSAPSFLLSSQTVELLEDSPALAWPFFATNISTGETSGAELLQHLTFVLVQISPHEDSARMFAQQPTLSSKGTLTLMLNANSYSLTSIVFSITLIDDGTSDNHGQNRSAAQSLVIHVAGVNDAPSYNSSQALQPIACFRDFTFLNESINCSAMDSTGTNLSNDTACSYRLNPSIWMPVNLHISGAQEAIPTLEPTADRNLTSAQLRLELTGFCYAPSFNCGFVCS